MQAAGILLAVKFHFERGAGEVIPDLIRVAEME